MALTQSPAQTLFHGLCLTAGIACGRAARCDGGEQGFQRGDASGMGFQPVDDVQQILRARGSADADFLQDGLCALPCAGCRGFWSGVLRREAVQRMFQLVCEGFQTEVFADVAEDADNFIAVERLGDIVIDAVLVGFADEVFAFHLREHDDFAGKAFSYGIDGPDPIEIGHEHVDDQDIGGKAGQHMVVHSDGGGQGCGDPAELVIFDDVLQHHAHGFIIVYE